MTEREYDFVSNLMESIYEEYEERTCISGIAESIMILLDELDQRIKEFKIK